MADRKCVKCGIPKAGALAWCYACLSLEAVRENEGGRQDSAAGRDPWGFRARYCKPNRKERRAAAKKGA